MNMYMGYEKDSISECAVLIFAHTAREAKRLCWPVIRDYCNLLSGDYPDLRVTRLRDHEWLRSEARHDYPHVIDNPQGCESCCQWGSSEIVEGLCQDCRDEQAWEESTS